MIDGARPGDGWSVATPHDWARKAYTRAPMTSPTAGRLPAREVRGRHPPLTLGLHLDQPQPSVARLDGHALVVHGGDRARLAVSRLQCRLPHLEAMSAEPEERAGGRVHRTDATLELARRRVRIQLRFRRLDLGGDGRGRVVLWLRSHRSGVEVTERAHEQRSGQIRQAPAQRPGGVVCSDGDRLRVQDRSRVEPGVHQHRRHAGPLVAGQDGPLDGSRAPPPGQEREVDVHTSQARDVQNIRRKQHPVRNDGDRVGGKRAQVLALRAQ